MAKEHDIMRKRLYERAGLPLWEGSYEEIVARVHRKSADFIRLMKNRLIMGHMRYGPLGGEDKPHYDHAASIRSRLKAWEADGNDEHLVDIANLCLVEYVEGIHPRKHFSAADGGGVQQK